MTPAVNNYYLESKGCAVYLDFDDYEIGGALEWDTTIGSVLYDSTGRRNALAFYLNLSLSSIIIIFIPN